MLVSSVVALVVVLVTIVSFAVVVILVGGVSISGQRPATEEPQPRQAEERPPAPLRKAA